MTRSRKLWFRVKEIADMVGASTWTVRCQIKQNHLRAVRAPGKRGTKPRQYQVHRTELVRWLVAGGFPLEQLRLALNPDGVLFTVRVDPELTKLLVPARVIALPTMFHLGLELRTRSCWGAVIDLPAVGTAEAVQALTGFARLPDRPELVGLYGDDGYVPGAEKAFDVLLPKVSPPQTLARAILRLRPRATGE